MSMALQDMWRMLVIIIRGKRNVSNYYQRQKRRATARKDFQQLHVFIHSLAGIGSHARSQDNISNNEQAIFRNDK